MGKKVFARELQKENDFYKVDYSFIECDMYLHSLFIELVYETQLEPIYSMFTRLLIIIEGYKAFAIYY